MTEPSQLAPKHRSRLYRFVWRPLRWMLVRLPVLLVKWTFQFTKWLTVAIVSTLNAILRPSWWRSQWEAARRLSGVPTIPLRKWLVLALAMLILLPVAAGVITANLFFATPSYSRSPNDILLEGQGLWTDLEWQADAAAELAEQGVDVVLYENGLEVFRTSEDPLEGNHFPGELRQFNIDDEGVDGTAYIYGGTEFDDEDWPIPVVAITTLILTFIGMAVFFGRHVVKPLEATSIAAGDVAGGDLAITLPSSHVREVADLNDAFEGMAGKLSETLEHETDLDRRRRQFVGAVAHDLRTPLFSLRGSLEAIQTGVADTEEKRQHYLSIAQQKAEALERLVSDLFEFTRVEAPDLAMNRQPVVIGELVEHTVASFQTAAERKAVSIAHSDESSGQSISADAHLLGRAFDNLMDNAVRFTPSGGQVSINTSEHEKSLVVTVTDTGPGIPSDVLPHIFEPHYRGESSRNPTTGGLGLGLTIAKNAVTAHGGQIEARNRPEGGAEFIVTIPAS